MENKREETTGQKLLANRQAMLERKLLTNREFCDRLGMSYEWGRRMVQRRQIAFVQIGRSVRIPEEELARFIEANTVSPAQGGR